MGRRPNVSVASGLAAFAALVAACGGGSFDVANLERASPALGEFRGHRLRDLTPYVWPSQDQLTLLVCRWPDARPIPISLPSGRDPALVRAAERAVSAMEQALPITFERRERIERHGIELRFVDPERERVVGAGNAVADCALDPDSALREPADTLPAELVYASVWLRTEQIDAFGRVLPFSPDEVAGSVLHELGHALGFQGHAHAGATVMVRAVEEVRSAGRRVLAGEPFSDATLEALYHVPSGTVVRRARLAPGTTRYVDAMLALARRSGLAGPFLRVGDRLARVTWRDRDGTSYPVTIDRIDDALRSPESLALDPHFRTRALLRGGGWSGWNSRGPGFARVP